jgi:phage gpG-like protein
MDLELFGEKQFSRGLLRIGQNAGDMRPAFKEIHTMVLGVEKRQFDSQGQAFSGGWKPLAPSTKKRKAAENLDPRILHATGDLRKSLIHKTNKNHVFRASRDEMFVGSSIPYGPHHQWGSKDGVLPRRRPFEFDEAVRRDIVKTLQRHLVEEGEFGRGGIS